MSSNVITPYGADAECFTLFSGDSCSHVQSFNYIVHLTNRDLVLKTSREVVGHKILQVDLNK